MIKALPENFNNLSREDEIVNWVNVKNVNEDFVIIDDDKSLNDLPDFLKESLVQTSPHIGLTEDHLELIKSVSKKIHIIMTHYLQKKSAAMLYFHVSHLIFHD